MTIKLLVVGTRPEFFAMLDRLKIDRHPSQCPVKRVSTVRDVMGLPWGEVPYRVLSIPSAIGLAVVDRLESVKHPLIETDDETLKALGEYQTTLL